MSELFNIKMPSDLSEWSSFLGAIRLVWSLGAGLGGTTGGVTVSTSGTNSSAARKTFALTTSNDLRARAFFSGLETISMTGNDNFAIAELKRNSGAQVKIWLQLLADNGNRSVRLTVRNDAGITTDGLKINIDTPPNRIEVWATKAATSVSSDAVFRMYFDDVLKDTISGIDLFDHFEFDRIDVGMVRGVDAGTTGSFQFDEVVVRDDSTLIGAVSGGGVPPIIVGISTQYAAQGVVLSIPATVSFP